MQSGLSAGLRARVALDKHGFFHTHALGQNFILDDDLLENIVRLSAVEKDDCVLEIGPGAGVLTDHLADNCRGVLAIEVDQKLKPVLDEVLSEHDNVHIVYTDAMKCRLATLLEEVFPGRSAKVVANLPYCITAAAVEKLITAGPIIGDITLMVQKEAAEHITADIGTKSYGALTMLTGYFRHVETLMDVPPECFTPRPHVMSRLIHLTVRSEGVRATDDALLVRTVKSAFRMRRKTLVNNLTGDFGITRETAEALLNDLRLDARVRGEALTVDQIAQLSNALGTIL